MLNDLVNLCQADSLKQRAKQVGKYEKKTLAMTFVKDPKIQLNYSLLIAAEAIKAASKLRTDLQNNHKPAALPVYSVPS